MHLCCYAQDITIALLIFTTGIVCSVLIIPNNGRILYDMSDFEFGTTAMYECNTGFGLSDRDPVRVCSGNGSTSTGEWTGIEPICQGVCINSNP